MKEQPKILGSVSSEDPSYEAIDALFNEQAHVGKRSRQETIEFYNTLADEYNSTDIGGIVITELPRTRNRVGNLSNVLENRGLIRGQDFHAAVIKKDADGRPHPIHERKVAIKRLSAASLNKCVG